MGNYGSHLGTNTYMNPFIMVDNSEITSNNRFACDINLDSTKNTILANSNQRVKNYKLSQMFKDMVISYDGSKQIIKNSNNLVTGSEYIPSPGGNLPGGTYRDNTTSTNPIPVYKYMACCKGAIGTTSIDSNKPKVEIPIASVIRPSKDMFKPIYADVTDLSNNKIFTTFNKTINGTDTSTPSIYYDTNYINKIKSLNDAQLDSIINTCANGNTCIKANYVGLQIKTNTTNDVNTQCNTYLQTGQNSITENGTSNVSASCHSLMRHICSKQLYDQGCIGIKVNSNGNKYPAWIDKPTCRVYNNLTSNNDNDVSYLYGGSPDCTCVNAIHGHSLNNKPKYEINSGYENPYNLSSSDSNLYKNNTVSPYSLNVWNNNPYEDSRGDGRPGIKDGDCVNLIKGGNKPYVLPQYWTNNTNVSCTDSVNINGNPENIEILNKFNIINNCDSIARTRSQRPPGTTTGTSTPGTTGTSTPGTTGTSTPGTTTGTSTPGTTTGTSTPGTTTVSTQRSTTGTTGSTTGTTTGTSTQRSITGTTVSTQQSLPVSTQQSLPVSTQQSLPNETQETDDKKVSSEPPPPETIMSLFTKNLNLIIVISLMLIFIFGIILIAKK